MTTRLPWTTDNIDVFAAGKKKVCHLTNDSTDGKLIVRAVNNFAGRTSRDGKPFYCVKRGLGFGEYAACELPDCELESEQSAEIRRALNGAETKRRSRKTVRP